MIFEEDKASAEYGQFTAALKRTERRMVWTGTRYVARTVEVIDLGRPAPVTPSTKPLVRELGNIQPLLKPPTATERVLDYLEENGPQRIIDIHRALDIPVSTLAWAVQNHRSVEQIEGKRWRVCLTPQQPEPERRNKNNSRKVADYLKVAGPSIISEIAKGTGLDKITVRNLLYRNMTRYGFRRGKERKVDTANGGWNMAKEWFVEEEGK
jgi:hypothetical protein